jgi:hypothetical protein
MLNSSPEVVNISSSDTNDYIDLLRFQYIEKEKELYDTINSLQLEVVIYILLFCNAFKYYSNLIFMYIYNS